MTDDITLHIPGPIPVEPDVLAAMAQQVRQHYGADWVGYYQAFAGRLRRIFATSGSVYPLPASGSGGVEAMMSTLIGNGGRVGVIANGFFGDRVLQIARAHSAQAVALELPWNRPADPGEVRTWLRRTRVSVLGVVHSDTSTGVINPVAEIAAAAREEGVAVAVDAVSSLAGMPVETDAWGLAAVSTASQKCLEAPPGLAPVAVTKAGWELIDRQPEPARGWYLNLRTWREYEHSWPHHPYPVTLATNNIFALDRALERILAEGLEARFARHRAAQQALRRGLERLGFTVLADARWASPTITVAYPPSGASPEQIVQGLRSRHGIAIAGGLTQLAGKVIRVGHLGTQAYPEKMQRVVDALEACLKELSAARA
jgi:alanine-glyoxylate transaminase/serine-glyoxylate transaminase/serine-pyruvate transaminase